MSNFPMKIEVVTEIDDFIALQPEWDRLWCRANGGFFQTFSYCLHSLKKIDQPAHRSLHCLVGRENGQVVLIWPLTVFRRRIWKGIRPLGPNAGEYSNILIENDADAPARVAAAWAAMQASSHADLLYLPNVWNESELYKRAMRAKWVMKIDANYAPFARMRAQSDWDGYCSTLVGRAGRQPAYLMRRLAKQGKVQVRMVDHEDPACESLIDWLLTRKRQWAVRNDLDTAWIFSSSYRDFLVGLVTDPLSVQPFKLFVLTLDDLPISVVMLGVGPTRADEITASFDPAFAKFSPGMVLIDYCVKWAFDRRLDLDFGVGTERFKTYWSGEYVQTTTNFQIANTWWGRTEFGLREVARMLRAWRAALGRRAPFASGGVLSNR